MKSPTRVCLEGFTTEHRAYAETCWAEQWRITFRDTPCALQETTETTTKISFEGMGPSVGLRRSKPIPNKTRHGLQGIQERDEGLLVLRGQVTEAIPFLFG